MPRERREDSRHRSARQQIAESPCMKYQILHTYTIHGKQCGVTVRPVGGYDDRACGITAL